MTAEQAVDRLLRVMPEIIDDCGYSRRTCVLQTRIATVVLRELGFRARPLTCQVLVGNHAWCELAGELGRFPQAEDWRDRDDIWCLGIGPMSQSTGPGYDGHVIAVVDERLALDLTIDQCDRPKHGIALKPHRWEVGTEFLTGVTPAIFTNDGALVRYDALPGERDFLHAADWTEPVKAHSLPLGANPLPLVREAMRVRSAA